MALSPKQIRDRDAARRAAGQPAPAPPAPASLLTPPPGYVYVQQTRPANPPSGSLFVKTDGAGHPLPMDQWEVFA